MISSATTVHQDGHGAEVRHSPQSRGRIDRLRMAPHGPRRPVGRPPRPSTRSRSGPSGCSRRDGSCWRARSRFGSAAGLSTSSSLWSSERGELVSKDELMARVWPNTFVEESNLKVQVAGLRRVLGDRRGSNQYLATISGRGYRFVAPVTLSTEVPRDAGLERSAQSAGSRSRPCSTAPTPWSRSRPSCRTVASSRSSARAASARPRSPSRWPRGCSKSTITVSNSSIWRRCAIPSRCRARLLTRSAWRSAPRIRVPS